MMDELFDEVTVLNILLKKIPLDVFRKEKAENKWMNIFSTNDSFPLLYKLISVVFSMPVSNAFVEPVFSLVSAQWTKERNSLSEKTVKSILQVKVNLEVSCGEIQQFLGIKNCWSKSFLVQSMIRHGSHWHEYILFIIFHFLLPYYYVFLLSIFLGSYRWQP